MTERMERQSRSNGIWLKFLTAAVTVMGGALVTLFCFVGKQALDRLDRVETKVNEIDVKLSELTGRVDGPEQIKNSRPGRAKPAVATDP